MHQKSIITIKTLGTMRQISLNKLGERINEELSYNSSIEQIKVTYCCPVFMGGYKKEGSQMFAVSTEDVVKAIRKRGSKIAIGKVDTAYTEEDFRYTLFIDIVEL